MFLKQLCLSIDLSSSEWAAWIQAIGSIVAILGSAIVVIWQTNRQRNAAIQLEELRRSQTQLDVARTLLELVSRSNSLIENVRERFKDRTSVYKIATREDYFYFGAVDYLERSVASIPLHSLPSRFVGFAIECSVILTQMRSNIEQVIDKHRAMDAAQHTQFFDTLADAHTHMQRCFTDIKRTIEDTKL